MNLIIILTCILVVCIVFVILYMRLEIKFRRHAVHDGLLSFFHSETRHDKLFMELYKKLSSTTRGNSPSPSSTIYDIGDAPIIILTLTSVSAPSDGIPIVRCTDVKSMYEKCFSLLKKIHIKYVVMIRKFDDNISKIMNVLHHHENNHDTLLFYDHTMEINKNVIIFKNTDTNVLKLRILLSQFHTDNGDMENTILTDEIITNYANEVRENFTKVASYLYSTTHNISYTGISLYPDTVFTESYDHDDFVNIQNQERLSIPAYEQKIPFIIFQTFETRTFPKNMYNETIRQWKILNPEYTYMFYSTTDEYDFIRSHFPLFVFKAFDRLMPGAFKADLWRYCVLYQIGGVYADSRTSPLVRLKNIIGSSDDFITPKDLGTYGLWQGFLCSCPRHPIIEMCIRWICNEVIKRKYNEDRLEITGPMLIGKMLNIFLDRPPQTFIFEGIYTKHGYTQKIVYIDFTGTKCISLRKGGRDIFFKSTTDEHIWNIFRGTEHYGGAFVNKRIFKPLIFPAVLLILPFDQISALDRIKHTNVWLFCERIIINACPLSISDDALYLSTDVLFTKDINKDNLSRIASLQKNWLVCWYTKTVDDALSDMEWVRSIVWFENVFENLPLQHNQSYLR